MYFVFCPLWGCQFYLAPYNWFKPSSQIFLQTVPRRYFFCGSLVLFIACVLSRLFIAAFWSPVGKGLTSRLLFVMFIVILLLYQQHWIKVRSQMTTFAVCRWILQMLVLVWFQTVWHSDSVFEILFWKELRGRPKVAGLNDLGWSFIWTTYRLDHMLAWSRSSHLLNKHAGRNHGDSNHGDTCSVLHSPAMCHTDSEPNHVLDLPRVHSQLMEKNNKLLYKLLQPI